MADQDFLDRTRDSYDAVAVDYAEWIRAELARKPMDRALLCLFADLVRAADLGPVADVGCGPGRITEYLTGLGLSVFGVDLSPRMVAVARRQYPALRFDVGSMAELDIADNALGGLVAWYSIIHVPPELLAGVFAEFGRVLAPGGYLQLAFQVGDDVTHLVDAKGHRVALDFHRLRPDRITELLGAAGLEPYARTVREPDTEGEFSESTPQGYVLARKPAD